MKNQNGVQARILGIESYFPQKRLTNQDFEKFLETSDEWIVERTGIRERRMSESHETPGFMGALAAKKLLERLQISPEDINLIIVATITADYRFPASAGIVQEMISAKNAWGYDLAAACSGYLYALETARSFVESGLAKNVLLIAGEKMSSILDYQDRATCVLFGDAATATLISSQGKGCLIRQSLLKMDGSGLPYLYMPAGGSVKPPSIESLEKREHFVKQEGRMVYKRAVKDMGDVCVELLEKAGLKASDLKLFVPHQANLRIIESVRDRLGLSPDRVAINIDRYGNTTAATIPSALAEYLDAEKLKSGDKVLLASFGAGFTWGAILLESN